MILSKPQAALIGSAIIVGAYLYYWMMNRMIEKDEVGGVYLWAFLGSCMVVALFFSAIDFVKRLIAYRKEKLNNSCKYGNVKAGDCISTNRLNK